MANTKDFKVKNGIQPTAYHEAVGTVVSGTTGYNLAGASYDSVSFDTSAQLTNPQCIVFNTDGSKMYVLGFSPSPVLYQYTLSTAFDLSTASYSTKSFSFGGSFQTANRSFMFKPDGTKMYAVGTDGEKISSYSLSTAFDVDTATLDTGTFDITAQTDQPSGMCFNSDGSKVYVTDRANDRVHEYDLSTAYDITTMSYSSVFLDVSGQDTTPRGAVFSTDGTIMYLVGGVTNSVYEYSLTTAFDLSTASYSNKSFSFTGQVSGAFGVAFNSGATKMYLAGSDETIYQYSTALTTNTLDLSTGSVFEITPTSDIQISLSNPADSGTVSSATLLLDGVATSTYDIAGASYDSVSFSVASQDTAPVGVSFKSDGTKMYILGAAGDDVNEYDLSTAWDITTASFLQNFSVSSQDTSPVSIFFKPDGTKMYVLGEAGDDVNEYDLSTAWDISTASFLHRELISSQETDPSGLFFKPDGTKMYVSGKVGDDVNEYDLSTAWDVSTSSFVQSFSFSAQQTNPNNIAFSSDGTKFYVVGLIGDKLSEYSLTTAWDVSTASFVQDFSFASQDTGPYGIFFKPDGTKMYMAGITGDSIYQYTTGRTANVFYDNSISFSGDTPPVSPNNEDTDIITFFTKDGGTSYNALQVINGAS